MTKPTPLSIVADWPVSFSPGFPRGCATATRPKALVSAPRRELLR